MRVPTFFSCLAFVFGVASCAAPPTAPLRPLAAANTPEHESGSFTSHDGLALFEQSWHPAGKARAVLVAHHGLKDHSDRYGDFAQRLLKDGIATYAYDMRGHGRSTGTRATIDDFDDLLGDLAQFMDRVRAREPGVPIFLLGHSVGGAVVTLFTLERRPTLAGLIVLAPAIRADRMPFEAAATPVVVTLLPNFGLVNTPNYQFCRDPKCVKEMNESEFVYNSAGPARTAGALVDAMERIWDRAGELDVPLLGMHGTADTLTDPRGTSELVQRAKTTDRTFLLYSGLYHDLLHEPERAQVMDDLEKWITARIKP